MEAIYNPYLPLTEHIPDGEPHVFGDRVYIYGSHDRAGGKSYCEDHYSVWSAPVNDIRNWRNEGVVYLRTQDPSNKEDKMQLWAPDCTKGPDGRYYLYYCFSFHPEIGVAVSDSPAGPFEFYGHVKYPESIKGGEVLRDFMPFDPAVLTDDDGRVYLYYGFAPACEKEMKLPDFTEEQLKELPEEIRNKIEEMKNYEIGEDSMCVELEPDMLTCKDVPHVLVPGGHHSEGTGFEGHAFFEASSIRKLNGTYYFVYSSHKSHELCYATSDKPDSGFKYGGIIVSNGDIGLDGRKKPVYPLGNNHGGIEKIGEDYFIFYHRQTNGTEFSRQGMAEKIRINADGSIDQVEITSQGLNCGGLAASGSYPAAIACHLTDRTTSSEINYQNNPVLAAQVRVTEEQNHVFIKDIKDRTHVGYKYFNFLDANLLACEFKGSFDGTIKVAHDETGKNMIGEYEVKVNNGEWEMHMIPIRPQAGTHALYLYFRGKGTLDMKSLAFFSL